VEFDTCFDGVDRADNVRAFPTGKGSRDEDDGDESLSSNEVDAAGVAVALVVVLDEAAAESDASDADRCGGNRVWLRR